MGRPTRIEYSGATYYVTSVAARGRLLFEGPADYEAFLRVVEAAVRDWSLRLHAYCLLPRAIHLILRTERGNLSRAMRAVLGAYALHRRGEGRLYRARYRATLFERETYLTELVRLVHRIPVNAGLARRAGDYPWSSHRHYLETIRRPLWLDTGEIPKKNFDAFVARAEPPALWARFGGYRQPRVLGRPVRDDTKAPDESTLRETLREVLGDDWESDAGRRRLAMIAFRRFLHWEYHRLATTFATTAHLSRSLRRPLLPHDAAVLDEIEKRIGENAHQVTDGEKPPRVRGGLG